RGACNGLGAGVRCLADRRRADRSAVHLLPTLFRSGHQHRSVEGVMHRLSFCLLVCLLFAGGSIPMLARAQPAVETVTVQPDKAFFRPGEPVTFSVTANEGARVIARVTHLLDEVAQLEAPLKEG